MANDPHLLIAWGGALGTLDVWTNTLKADVFEGANGATLTYEEQNEILPAIQTACSGWVGAGMATGGGTHATAVKLSWVKANSIGPDGKYVYENTSVLDFAVVPGKGVNADYRNSLCVTLKTDAARGLAHIGRFYPPCTPSQITTADSPYQSDAWTQAYADLAADFINELNAITTASGKGIRIYNFATWEGAAPAFVTNRAVTSIEVDEVMDTQRRRTNRVPRQIKVSAITP